MPSSTTTSARRASCASCGSSDTAAYSARMGRESVGPTAEAGHSFLGYDGGGESLKAACEPARAGGRAHDSHALAALHESAQGPSPNLSPSARAPDQLNGSYSLLPQFHTAQVRFDAIDLLAPESSRRAAGPGSDLSDASVFSRSGRSDRGGAAAGDERSGRARGGPSGTADGRRRAGGAAIRYGVVGGAGRPRKGSRAGTARGSK